MRVLSHLTHTAKIARYFITYFLYGQTTIVHPISYFAKTQLLGLEQSPNE